MKLLTLIRTILSKAWARIRYEPVIVNGVGAAIVTAGNILWDVGSDEVTVPANLAAVLGFILNARRKVSPVPETEPLPEVVEVPPVAQ